MVYGSTTWSHSYLKDEGSVAATGGLPPSGRPALNTRQVSKTVGIRACYLDAMGHGFAIRSRNYLEDEGSVAATGGPPPRGRPAFTTQQVSTTVMSNSGNQALNADSLNSCQ